MTTVATGMKIMTPRYYITGNYSMLIAMTTSKSMQMAAVIAIIIA